MTADIMNNPISFEKSQLLATVSRGLETGSGIIANFRAGKLNVTCNSSLLCETLVYRYQILTSQVEP